MSEVKYDSVLVGYVEDPKFKDDGTMMGMKVRFKKNELLEIAEKYATPVNDQGQGDNIYLSLFPAKSGKWCCKCYDHNSEAAKEYRASKQAEAEKSTSDLPF